MSSSTARRGAPIRTAALAGARSRAASRCCPRFPSELESLNKGLPTLQFQSLSVSPFNSNLLQGGTQDNGTWETPGNPSKWENTMIGDGGQSGFDAANPDFRFHTFFNATPDVNFSGGDIADWNWISDPIFGTEPQSFYVPIISDPVQSGWMFVGTGHVWRTKTHGRGSMSIAELRQHCNEWFGDFSVTCGDWRAARPGGHGWASCPAPRGALLDGGRACSERLGDALGRRVRTAAW